jgi:DNA-binding transcriptional LysR family regulator
MPRTPPRARANKLASVDLNLLPLLRAALRLESVTRAAREVALSQSAASHALERLRQHFDDGLLVRHGQRMVRTPLGDRLLADLEPVLTQLEDVLVGRAHFEPKQATRTFRIGSSDYAELLFIPKLSETFTREAPGLDVWFQQGDVAELAHDPIDLAISAANRRAHMPSLRYAPLFQDEFVCMVRRGHPLLTGRFTAARFAAARHLFIAPGGRPGGAVDVALAKLGLSRRIAVAVPHFLVAPYVVAQTDLVLTLGARLATELARTLPLVVLTPPIELPSFEIGMYWQVRWDGDEAHRYLRDTLKRIAPRATLRSPRRAPEGARATPP